MEEQKRYLSFEEYQELGGTLEEAPFNILEFEARKKIDQYTFGRLKELTKQIQEVRMCSYKIINLLNEYSAFENKGISSENIDGYSVSYSANGESTSKSKIEGIRSIIRTYLAECYLDDGTPYLYTGV